MPTIYWTGTHTKYHVMVMDRLGKSLQHIVDTRPMHRINVAEMRATGLKCLELLQSLHNAGYVHGDVKPENFLVGHRLLSAAPEVMPVVAGAGAAAKGSKANRGAPKRRKTHGRASEVEEVDDEDVVVEDAWSYQETGEHFDEAAADDGSEHVDLEETLRKYGLYMVDLGLGLHWSQKELREEAMTHVPYKQRVDHFSGTVRYASVNVHLGRYSTRRDDLESLAYMLIFMFLGSLPWQGYTGPGKEMQVCRKKGTTAVSEICRGCPEELAYFLAYVREMKYDQEPDYDYLRTCLDFGSGRLLIRKWIADDTVAKLQASTAAAGTPTSAGAGAGAGGAVTPAAAAGAAAPKRKREDGAPALPAGSPSSGAGSAAGKGGAAQSTTSAATAASAGSRTGGRPMVVVPKSMLEVERQWILVSTSQSYHRGMSPLGQTVTMHTSWKNLVNKIKDFWAQQKRICVMSFDNSMWSSVFDDENTGFIQQSVHYSPGKEFPGDWVRQRWNEGFMVTSVTANDSGWGVVASHISAERNYTQQSYMATSTFPSKWIAEKWAAGFMVTSVACFKSARPFWVVVVSSGTKFTAQAIEMDFKYPSESVRARWKEHMMVTSVAASCDQIVLVLSRYQGSEFERQHCVRTPNSPIKKVEDDWKEGLYVTGLAHGRVL